MIRLLALLLLSWPALAANTIVSASGNDANDCISAPCRTIQRGADVAGQIGNVSVAPGYYQAGANVIYYRMVNIIGNCSDPASVVVDTPGTNAFIAQDHAILTVSCLTVMGTGGIGLFARQFAIMDYANVIFGAMSIHVSAAEMSKINCQSATIQGNAVYHAAANGMSTVSLTCSMSFPTGPSFSAFVYAVRKSIVDGSGATINGATNGLQFINDASLTIQPTGGFPGNGNVCQNGCQAQ